MEKIFIMTFGCSLNSADSERIAACLKEKGFELAKNADEANLLILNSCAVKGPTESKFFTLLGKLKADNKKVIVAGCIAQAMPEKLEEYSKIGTDQLDAIGEVIEETLNGNIVSMIVEEKKDKLSLPHIRSTRYVEIIPICNGCLGSCTYCITKKARSIFYSYPLEKIYETAKKAISEGVKEIYLTSQDNGCYGKDINSNLPQLLNKISSIEGDYMIRVGMANPNHVLKHLDKLIEAFKHPRIYKFLHIPVQSGNNYVLEHMKRDYMIEDFYLIVNKFRKEIPDITISTDIIVGYPTETDAFFKDTITLIKEAKPDILNISKFWPRAHTPAEKLEQLPGETVKARAIEAMNIFNWMAFEKMKRWQGWEGKVTITEKGKEGTLIGRNFAYKQVILKEDVKIGEAYDVKITNTTAHDLRGVLL